MGSTGPAVVAVAILFLPAVTGRTAVAGAAAITAEMSALSGVEETGGGWFVVAAVPGGAGTAELPASAVGAGAGEGTASCESIEFAAISVVPCEVLARKLTVAGFGALSDVEVVAESAVALSACPLRGACVTAFPMEYAGGTSDASCSESGIEDLAAAADVWPGVWTRGVWMSDVGSAVALKPVTGTMDVCLESA